MNHNNYVYFVLNKNGNANYSFNGYTDKESGLLMQIFKGQKFTNKAGVTTEVAKRFSFDPAHRTIRVHKNDRSLKSHFDNNGKEVFLKTVDFLRGYPDCKGSPNGNYADADKKIQYFMFSEVKDEEDATTAVDAKRIRNKAEGIALDLKGAELKEMAVLCQCFDEGAAMQMHKVAEFAAAKPETFLGYYESPERSAKALLQKAVSVGSVQQRGTLFVFGNETLGASADLAVSKLMGDKDISKALTIDVKSKKK